MTKNTDKNIVKYGLENVHYAPITETDGITTYETPIPLPGAVELSMDPEGEQVKFPADNRVYFMKTTNSGYAGTLNLALIPDQFKKDILGYVEDENGILFEDANAITKNFALLFEFKGDANATRHVLYKVGSGRPKIGSKTTEDSIEVETEAIDITATTPIDNSYVKAKIAPGMEGYDNWYQAVYKYTKPVIAAKTQKTTTP